MLCLLIPHRTGLSTGDTGLSRILPIDGFRDELDGPFENILPTLQELVGGLVGEGEGV
jgi:hypothetical protein